MIRERAAQTLIEAGVVRLPVRLQTVASRLGIGLFTYEDYARAAEVSLQEIVGSRGADGFAVYIAGHRAIFYRAGGNPCRVRWTIAHELGHLLLGHMEQLGGNAATRAEQERQANRLAAELLCPSALVAACGCDGPEELAQLCDISPTAAGAAQRTGRLTGYRLTAAEQQLTRNCADWLWQRRQLGAVELPQLRSRRI